MPEANPCCDPCADPCADPWVDPWVEPRLLDEPLDAPLDAPLAGRRGSGDVGQCTMAAMVMVLLAGQGGGSWGEPSSSPSRMYRSLCALWADLQRAATFVSGFTVSSSAIIGTRC